MKSLSSTNLLKVSGGQPDEVYSRRPYQGQNFNAILAEGRSDGTNGITLQAWPKGNMEGARTATILEGGFVILAKETDRILIKKGSGPMMEIGSDGTLAPLAA